MDNRLNIIPDKVVTAQLDKVLGIEPPKDNPLEAKFYLSIEELATEINYLNNPKNQSKKDFGKRKSNLYAWAVLNDKSDMMKWLESRFNTTEHVPDTEINLILK